MLRHCADSWPALSTGDEAYFKGWLSSATDDCSYCFVDDSLAYEDWVDVRVPIQTLDTVHGGTHVFHI